MSSFSASFASTSFVTDAEAPAFEFTATVVAPLAVQVVSPLVFSTADGWVKWSVVAAVAGAPVDLTGDVLINAGEDEARVATFSVIPASVIQLDGFESAQVTIDIVVFRTGQQSTVRRFTGVVETVEFNPGSRVADLHCRDGYQERPKSCATAAEVESLFGGLAHPCSKIVEWDAASPDPVSYFSRLQASMVGACAIDSRGLWRAIPWTIGAPLATFSAGDIDDNSVSLSRANRRELPTAIRATLNFRYNRLHCVEKTLTWDDPGYSDHLVYGLPTLSRATVQQALEGLSGWIVKGKPIMTGPIAGAHPVIVMGSTQYYVIPYETAQTSVDHLEATLYRRWYQQVEVAYTIDIPMGGSSDRQDVAAATFESKFDAALWETTPTSENSLGLYLTNPPTVVVPPTGYEGLPGPFPPGNSAIDYYPDVSSDDLQSAGRHVVALALRKAAAGRRKQTVKFSRPIDPRWEIGDVLAIDVYGVSATGQIISFEDRLDHDSGDATSTITLACPDGAGAMTAFSASVAAPTSSIYHDLFMPLLDTHKGGWTSTPDVPIEDNLIGFLCNVIMSAPAADLAKPSYIAQFRLIMPEIPADIRDPLSIQSPITAAVSIAGGGVAVSF